MPDGTVEFVAEGEEQQVARLVDWAWQGPPSARVEKVDVDVLDDEEDFTDFSVRY
jgi:acylphosphatase